MSEGLALVRTHGNVHVENAPPFRYRYNCTDTVTLRFIPGEAGKITNRHLHLSRDLCSFLADVAHDDEIRSDCSGEGTMISDSVVVIGDE